jgi:predicted transcriptional regulator
MPESPRLSLQLNPDVDATLEWLAKETGYSRSAVACAAIRTMAHIRRHGKGRALVLAD